MKLVQILHGACLATLVVPLSAQSLVRSVAGPTPGALYGKACIRIDDANGDGYDDLLVGAPGFNLQRGAIYCLSGAHLALGNVFPTVWSLAPAASPGDQFGAALAAVGDVTGDGIGDFLVGQPGYDSAPVSDIGAVRLVNGHTHAILSIRHGPVAGAAYGSSMALISPTSIAIGSPGANTANNFIWVDAIANLTISGNGFSPVYFFAPASERLGTSLASGVDLDGDGFNEILAGAPGRTTAAGANAGGIQVFYATTSSSGIAGNYDSDVAGENLGESLDASHDYDGDGVADIVAGAPKWVDSGGVELGRVRVLSGASVLTGQSPQVLYTLTGSTGVPPSNDHFGTAVRASADLNGDGIGDILVGAPDRSNSIMSGSVSVHSGLTGAELARIEGSFEDQLGDGLTGAIEDLDGDGFRELVVAGSRSNANGPDSGVVECYRLFPNAPSSYCTGKTNSLGCVPSVSSSGQPSSSSTSPFTIGCSNQLNQKSGLLMYSHQLQAAAFQGGTLCVKPPLKRTAPQSSGGSASGSDCTGSFSFDFNARIQSGVDSTLVAGAEIYAQYWARDPASPSMTSLSNALRFLINP